jgi:hypothetical protein
MRSFASAYDEVSVNHPYKLKERLKLNYSQFDMVHALTEKIDKKTQQEMVRRVLEAFLSQNPKIGFSKVIILLEINLKGHDSSHPIYIMLLLRTHSLLLDHLYLPSRHSRILLPESIQEIHFTNR